MTEPTFLEDVVIGPGITPFNFYYLITAEITCPSGLSSANGPFGFANRDRDRVDDDPEEVRPSGPVLDGACQP